MPDLAALRPSAGTAAVLWLFFGGNRWDAPKAVLLSVRARRRREACKFFSEFNVGNVSEQSIGEVWRSDAYERIRGVLGTERSPACSKCSNLYLQTRALAIHI